MNRKLKIAYITSLDPLDKKSWSGSIFRIYNSLKTNFEIVPLGPILRPRIIGGIIVRLDKICQYLFNKKYFRDQNILRSLYFANSLQKKIKNENFDLIFSPASSSEIAFLKTDLPIFKYDDSTFNQMINYYPAYQNILPLSLKEANYIEKKAFKKSVANIFSSNWAMVDAIEHYKLKPENTFVVKLGADIKENTSVDENFILNKSYNKGIKILFIGRDWERKRGNIVLESFKLLIEKGYNVDLTVCGCIPPTVHEKMKVYPFLDKNDEKDFEIFTTLFKESHFLFVPSEAECYGLVFCEAFAFGVPVITTNTGGISSIVENNVNGIALPETSTEVEYTKEIERLLNNTETLKIFSKNAFKKYNQELNWKVWTEKVTSIINNYFEKI